MVNEIVFGLVVMRSCKWDPSDPYSNSERLMLMWQNRSRKSPCVPAHKMGEKKHFLKASGVTLQLQCHLISSSGFTSVLSGCICTAKIICSELRLGHDSLLGL